MKSINLSPEQLFENADDEVLQPLAGLLKDDDCFKRILFEKREFLPSRRQTVEGFNFTLTYDNASIKIKYCNYPVDRIQTVVETQGRISSYLYELQADLCDYVVAYAENILQGLREINDV